MTQSPFQELSGFCKWRPILDQVEEEGGQLVALEPQIKSLIRGVGSRNRELFEEYPLLK
ncbi:MAG: hypothetical protein H0X26_07730 [Alphaproteobacteria bacterium]|nr:hypothetical protein [Alphaproteobacteria bacterium]